MRCALLFAVVVVATWGNFLLINLYQNMKFSLANLDQEQKMTDAQH
jgi:hypothetical protein